MFTFVKQVTARLEGYPEVWSTGDRITEWGLTLGQQEKSSRCSIVLADPSGSIAADLIKHVQTNGGIQVIPGTRPDAQPSQTPATPVTGKGSGTFSTDLTPNRRAFLDVLAFAEGADYNVMFTATRFNGYSDHPRKIHCSGGLCSDAAGRYQFLSTTWDGVRRALNLSDFSPASQDKGAIYLIQQRGALADVDAGRFEAAVLKLGEEWASLPGSPHGQPIKSMDELRRVYDSALAKYQSGSQPQPQKLDPTLAAIAAKTGNTDGETFKGAKLLISIDQYNFEFFHQGTDYNLDAGTVTLTGQGIRWVLNRRPRNKTEQDLTLKQLATKIAKAHGVKLSWQADYDINYEHISQQGISDYQLLLREAKQNGLFVSEENGTLTVKALQNIRDTAWNLSPGLNLISARFRDEAIDGSKNDESSSLGQSESKVELDALSGQLVQSKPDIDPVKDQSVSGAPASQPTGKVKPGEELKQTQARSRYKRVKGLPSTFVIPLTLASLGIKPMDAVRTSGLQGVLSRVWLVDSVAHSSKGQTTLQCYSPVEVLDTSGDTSAPPSANTVSAPKGQYIYPISGKVITSPMGMRVHPITGVERLHAGIDIDANVGDPVRASNDGEVSRQDFDPNGYGLWIEIKHPDGFRTRYAHNSKNLVRLGQPVKRGETIALAGSTGSSTAPHIHFEVRDPQGNPVQVEKVGLSGRKGDVTR